MYKISGMMFFFAGATILMGIITAEIFYPNYSISQNMISNLGATRPPHSIIKEPSAIIFDSSLIVAGILILIGTYILIHKAHFRKFITLSFTFLGFGTLGVGIFPAFHLYAHPVAAFITFFFGGITAILSSRITKPPFNYVSYVLGLTTLGFLFLGLTFPSSIVPFLGRGGTERWVAYPVILWLIGFGGYLMNTTTLKSDKR